MKIIFLDIDGVLNDHEITAGGCCGIKLDSVKRLNRLLFAVPSAQIVLISAWRYMILCKDMTIKGMEYLLQTHGLACRGRIIGITETDGPMEGVVDGDDPEENDSRVYEWGIRERRRQVEKAIEFWKPKSWVILDDLPLAMPRHVQTDDGHGVTDEDMLKAIAFLDLI